MRNCEALIYHTHKVCVWQGRKSCANRIELFSIRHTYFHTFIFFCFRTHTTWHFNAAPASTKNRRTRNTNTNTTYACETEHKKTRSRARLWVIFRVNRFDRHRSASGQKFPATRLHIFHFGVAAVAANAAKVTRAHMCGTHVRALLTEDRAQRDSGGSRRRGGRSAVGRCKCWPKVLLD